MFPPSVSVCCLQAAVFTDLLVGLRGGHCQTTTWAAFRDPDQNKGIRDAGSTADFRILFEILKFKHLKIWKIWEHLENFRTFGKFGKVLKIWKISQNFIKFRKF